MDDNQFRHRPRDGSHPAKTRAQTDDDVINLYDDFKDPSAGKLDPEVEELKRLAQSDALKAYAWIRSKLALLNAKFSKLNFSITPKQLKFIKIGVVVVAVGALLVRVAPGVYQNVTEEGGILGESVPTTPSFPVLTTNGGEQEGLVFDSETNSASFQDTIGGLLATVSQQEVPAEIKADQSGVEKLALSVSDKKKIDRYDTQKGQIYVIEAQNGAQTVMFSHEDLLVFIRSSGNVAGDIWVEYVNNLQLNS